MTDWNDDRVTKVAARLQTDVTPPHDLWPGIAAHIEAPVTRRRWQPYLAQAAAVLLLVAGSSGITWYTMQDAGSGGTAVISADRLFEQTAFGGDYQLGAGFQSARNSLIDKLEAEAQKLSVEDRATIDGNLRLIHNAIDEMNAALAEDPDNELLQEQLLRTYREELALLRRVGGLTRNVMLRNDI